MLVIKNIGVFFVSLIILIVGLFIVMFDYSQIQFFDNLDDRYYYLLDQGKKDIHQRLKIEFFIGEIIVVAGIMLFLFSMFWKFERK